MNYYHIMKLKNLMTYSGINAAMEYLNNIEPMELRKEIACLFSKDLFV